MRYRIYFSKSLYQAGHNDMVPQALWMHVMVVDMAMLYITEVSCLDGASQTARATREKLQISSQQNAAELWVKSAFHIVSNAL